MDERTMQQRAVDIAPQTEAALANFEIQMALIISGVARMRSGEATPEEAEYTESLVLGNGSHRLTNLWRDENMMEFRIAKMAQVIPPKMLAAFKEVERRVRKNTKYARALVVDALRKRLY